VKAGDLVVLKSSGRLMKVLQIHLKTSEVCVIPAESLQPHIGVWVKAHDIEVPGLRSKNSHLSI